MQHLPIALVLNAGGQSRRMGRNKALLPVPPDQVPLVRYILRRLIGLVNDHCVVVSDDPQVAQVLMDITGIRVLADHWSAAGALGGVATGLTACREWAMVVACDMPLVDPAIFARLIEVAGNRPQVDAVIPFVAGMAQPFHGLWRRSALPQLEAQIEVGELSLHKALAKLNVAWIDEQALGIEPEDLAFTNVNTPEEWERALMTLRNQPGQPDQ